MTLIHLVIVEGKLGVSKYVVNMLFVSIFPLLFVFFTFLTWKVVSLINPSRFKETYKRNTLTTSLVLIFLVYPSITSYTFGMFNCKLIEKVNYLSVDFGIVCWSETHIELLLYFTLPIIIFWVVGFPLTIFCILYKKRKEFDDKQTIMKFGMFYIGLTDKCFFW